MHELPPFFAERTRSLRDRAPGQGGYVLYWMHHALRFEENPALDVARLLAADLRLPLLVCQGLGGAHRYHSDRHHFFILQCAREVAAGLAAIDVGYWFNLDGSGGRSVRALASQAAAVVVEEMPVPPFPRWQAALAATVEAPVLAVDARCIVPMCLVGERCERAFAFRRAASELYEARVDKPYPQPDIDFARPFVAADGYRVAGRSDGELLDAIARCDIDHDVGPVWHTPGGGAAAEQRWSAFRACGLADYHRLRNDAGAAFPRGVSRMSPYLHYGCISPLRIAREAAAAGGDGAKKYLDELFVWRELAHNFCFHTRDLETLTVLPDWARETLGRHAGDPRPALHSWDTLARGRTGDELWDLAQRSLLRHGELHNNLRMTWAKQLLQWRPDPASALAMLIDLNHRYALDGSDPNSYGGLLWAMGAFDRPFPPPRPVLGTVRPRDTATHARRLDVARYGARVSRPAGRSLNVGVIGAGICGLAAARTLCDHGHAVTVLDKGRGVGGRCATRRTDNGPFDHGAQYFTARSAGFARRVAAWREEGWLAPWPGRLVYLADGSARPRDDDVERLVAVPSMSALAKKLASDLSVQVGTRIDGCRRERRGWCLQTDAAKPAGPFDAVLITAPPPQAISLLPGGGSDALAARAAAAMAPCWAVMLTLPRFDPGFDAARVADSDIDWLGVDSSKPGRGGPDGTRVVVHATTEFSSARLEDSPQAVAERLTDSLRALLPHWPSPSHAVAHRWRFARAAARDTTDGVLDAGDGVWLAGDGWRGLSRIEDAWCSGIAAAGRILAWGGAEHDETDTSTQETTT